MWDWNLKAACRGVAVLAVTCLLAVADVSASWSNPPWRKSSGIEHRTFRSEAMRTEVGYNICLPPEYQSNLQQRFPVILYLHGYKGDESSYLDYAEHWRSGMRATGPSILVFVNGGETSFFSDSPDGSVLGETVVKELVAHLDKQYRTIPDATMRSLHGYSMGGFGALKLAFKHPDLFGSAVAYGATLFTAEEMQREAGKLYRKMFGSTERFQANNPLALAQAKTDRPGDRPAIALVIGARDEFLDHNRQLAMRLKASKWPHELIELPGVKHSKDPIYEKGAQRAFQFTGAVFRQKRGESTQAAVPR